MKTETILRNARARIANKDNWVKGAMYAKDKVTKEFAKLGDAKCFCSIGAVAAELGVPDANSQVTLNGTILEDWVREVSEKQLLRALKYLNAAARDIDDSLGGGGLWFFNDRDERKHEEVLAMFDLAIKRARRRHANGG